MRHCVLTSEATENRQDGLILYGRECHQHGTALLNTRVVING
jgi:hypothetical protein